MKKGCNTSHLDSTNNTPQVWEKRKIKNSEQDLNQCCLDHYPMLNFKKALGSCLIFKAN